jgi:hypothetical protein
LPENILTNDLEEEFFKVAEFKDMAEKVKHVKKNVNRLPPCNKQTLKLYIEHLVFVAEKQDVNQMTVENLLLCITGASSNTPVFFVLILNYEEIFLGVTPTKEEKIQKLEKLNYVITTDSMMPKAKDGEYEGKDSKEDVIELKDVFISNLEEEKKEIQKEIVEEKEVTSLEKVVVEESWKKEEEKEEEIKQELKDEDMKVENQEKEWKQEEEEEEEVKVEHLEEIKKEEVVMEEQKVEFKEEELKEVEMEKKEEVLVEVEMEKKEFKEMEQLQEQLEKEIQHPEEKQNLEEPQPSSEGNHKVLPEETKKEEELQ